MIAGLNCGAAGRSFPGAPAAMFAFTVSSSFSNPGASSHPHFAARQYFRHESMLMEPFAKALILTACKGKSLSFCRRALGAMDFRAFWPQFEAHGTAFTAHLPFFLSMSSNALEFAAFSLLHGHWSSVRHLS